NNVVSPVTRYPVMNIGCSLDAKGYYNGIIDDVRLYNRALSEQEIHAIIQEPLEPGFVPG
ncbi:MAG: LamG-like jellyroll fold domain-containing protein, partial [Planctomycetota bacterium]